MKISLVTSVYQIRKSRPLDYYLVPTQHLIQDLANSNIYIWLFTDLDASQFPIAANLKIKQLTYDQLISDIWPDEGWAIKYKKAMKDRLISRFEEKSFPELLAVWLGKFKMMEFASLESDCVLWQDSGIRGRMCKKKFRLYRKCIIRPKIYTKAIEMLVEKNPLILMKCYGYVNPYHGVNMKFYSKKDTLIRGGFILSKSEEVRKLKEKICHYWNLLISNKHYGTEENPLTLYYWERNDIKILDYDEWLYMLKIGGCQKLPQL